MMYVIHATGPFTDNTQHISQQTRRWHAVGTMYKRLLEVTGQLTCLSTPIIRYNTSMMQHAICRVEIQVVELRKNKLKLRIEKNF